MNTIPLAISDVVVFDPLVYRDERGSFFESFNQRTFEEAIGARVAFVQDNHSCSSKHVLRGLHYQIGRPQGKLIRVTAGVVFDVAVDIRKRSPTFGQWVGEILSADNKKQLWMPEGFAHGFVALSDQAEVLYEAPRSSLLRQRSHFGYEGRKLRGILRNSPKPLPSFAKAMEGSPRLHPRSSLLRRSSHFGYEGRKLRGIRRRRIKRPTTGRRNRSGALSGTMRPWESSGRSIAHRDSP